MNQLNNIQIYTDGSCHTQHKVGGWAAIIFKDENKLILSGTVLETTHNRMELLSVIKAIKFIDKENIIDYQLDIFTDSQYVAGIESRIPKFKQNNFKTKKGISIQNIDLVQELIRLIETHKIKFIKVKAHQKATKQANYNRDVDKLARKCVRQYVAANHRINYLKGV